MNGRWPNVHRQYVRKNGVPIHHDWTSDLTGSYRRAVHQGGSTAGRLEHLRGIALGFRNIARSLLEAGGFKQHLHP
ncbi:hypothetical protein KEM60_02195 [Austwickia sp. TVS 96-490-7B]|nr:hypothetical protein [Austwickia sp. TVS 96-490-7B]